MSSVAQMYEGLLKKRVEFRLFNGNPVAVEAQYNGETYRIPGRNDHYVSPKGEAWPEPGVLPVKSRPGHTTFKKGRALDTEPDLTAQRIVEFIVGPDGISGKLGKSGVRVLLPDGDEDGRNEMIRQDAIETADRKQYENAQSIITAHENANKRRETLGQKPLPPNPVADAAYQFVANQDAGRSPIGFPFSCPKCHSGAKTTEDLRAHIMSIHRPMAQSILKDSGLDSETATPSPAFVSNVEIEDEADPVIEPKRRGRPPLARA